MVIIIYRKMLAKVFTQQMFKHLNIIYLVIVLSKVWQIFYAKSKRKNDLGFMALPSEQVIPAVTVWRIISRRHTSRECQERFD